MNENEPNNFEGEGEDFVAPPTGEDSQNQETESVQPSIEQLLKQSGFVEDEQMLALKQQWIETFASAPEQAAESMKAWKAAADELVSSLPGQEWAMGTIAADVTEARVWKACGEVDNYYDCLERALRLAENMGFEDTIAAIRTEWSSS